MACRLRFSRCEERASSRNNWLKLSKQSACGSSVVRLTEILKRLSSLMYIHSLTGPKGSGPILPAARRHFLAQLVLKSAGSGRAKARPEDTCHEIFAAVQVGAKGMPDSENGPLVDVHLRENNFEVVSLLLPVKHVANELAFFPVQCTSVDLCIELFVHIRALSVLEA